MADHQVHEQTSLLHSHSSSPLPNTSSSSTTRPQSPSPSPSPTPYPSYTTTPYLSLLSASTTRLRALHSAPGLRPRALALLDASSGYLAVALIGALTACIAFVVDIATATVADWKEGYCKGNVFRDRERCEAWKPWSSGYWSSFAIYSMLALVFGMLSALATSRTKIPLPSANPSDAPKTLFAASGSGIPEIKTILSGFDIPGLLTLKVVLVKAFGAVFAVSTGMCLGKEGPFVHISTCIGSLVGERMPRFANNGRKMRELLSAACASGLCVAFGAPIGGVLFSYEEISTYFPRPVLWRAFLCSASAAMVLKALNPTGTEKLVLFETDYGTRYDALHYFVFAGLGVAGGIFGGVFCRANFAWSKWFRRFGFVKRNPIAEVLLVVLVTVLLQWPNPLTRETGDKIIKNLLVDCSDESKVTYVCRSEKGLEDKSRYFGWLVYGTLVKLFLTTITFGIKVPSGVIIPALNGGAFFGRLVGQAITDISPGIFAMVGAGAFLAGVSRMTISFVVIMFELTGELEYVVPNMLAILIAKWIADAIFPQGVYDIGQSIAGHPFLTYEHAMKIVQSHKIPLLLEDMLPSKQDMESDILQLSSGSTVPRNLLSGKIEHFRSRGLLDGGLVLVNKENILRGYISQSDLESNLSGKSAEFGSDAQVRLLSKPTAQDSHLESELDLSSFVDRSAPVIGARAPLEYAIEYFAKLGLSYICVVDEDTGKTIGLVAKKQLLGFLESL